MKEEPVSLTYDPEADALYIYLAHGKAGLFSMVSPDGLTFDVAVDDTIIGIEVLAASEHPVFSQLVPREPGAVTA